MLIDFTPVNDFEIKLADFAQQFSLADLRQATNESLDLMLAIIGSADDAQVTFFPDDPYADDPFAPPEEQHQGWNLAHVVAHVTASAEEWAAYSAILARGIAYPREPRLRYEPDWHTLTTRAQVIHRIGESRRMRLAALDQWADPPHLDVFREMSDRFLERNGPVNAKTAFLFGLKHEHAHHDQLRETARQACAASAVCGD